MESTKDLSQVGNSVIASATGVAAIGASMFNVPGAIFGAIIGGAIGAMASKTSRRDKFPPVERGEHQRRKQPEAEAIY